MLYGYSTPEVVRHNGWTKIGYTEQDVETRINQQTHTADVKWQLEWKGNATFDDGSGETFIDKDFHAYLRKSGIEQENGKNNEWFHVDGIASKQMFRDFREDHGILKTTETVIPAGESSSADLVLTVNAQGKIQPFDSYLLPVTITSVEGAQADHIQQTVYYLLSGAEDVWAMPLADRSTWQVVEVSSEETSGEGSENGHAIHAFDGLKGTFWHTQWKGNEPQPPHHIVVDMGQEVKMLGFQYVSRDHGEAWPQEMTMETSLDGSKWESAGTYSDLPAGAKEEFRSYFPGFKQARYFRLTITAVYSGKWATAVAEINAISIIK